jgi:hypothetical protein
MSTRRNAAVVCLLLALLLGWPAVPTAQAGFGFKDVGLSFTNDDGSPATAAGSHPFAWTTTLAFNTVGGPGGELPDQALKDLRIQLPVGLVGTPALLPRCSHSEFYAKACPAATMVGTVEPKTEFAEGQLPLYSLVPLPGAPAELAFIVKDVVPVEIQIKVNPAPPYNLVATMANTSNAVSLFGAILEVRGVPGAKPLLTLPRSCSGPLVAAFEGDSWEEPGAWTPPAFAEAPGGVTDCGELGFEPSISAQPTTTGAREASGLELRLDANDDGIASPAGTAEADVRKVTLVLPEGMTANASIAEGLAACSRADYARETLGSAPGAGCPNASKIGSVDVESPSLEQPLRGSLFVAQPDDPDTSVPGSENPFDSLLALYIVFRDPNLSILVKQAMMLEADPETGRLTATISDIPPLPFSRLQLHLRGGARSLLVTPSACGAHAMEYSLSPSSGAAALEGQASFSLVQGCGAPGFRPALSAGVTNPVGGASSPFVLNLGRHDGEQNPSQATLTLPRGLAANFGAVPRCPESLAAKGACPADTRVGSVRIAAGAGAIPVWIPSTTGPPGAVYFAGPYRGAPFSLAIVVPAQVGPFDLGTEVIRAALSVDPVTAQAKIRLDPLPQILDGIPIAYRQIRLLIDRSGFVINPTGCETSAVEASVTSATGTVAPASDRFRVGRCSRLPFKPKLSLRLAGPTHRGAHPELRATVTARRGDANVRRVALTLPATELLDSRHIGMVCTRVEFAARECPSHSIYGYAKAWTPLLHRPLEGPVYLRASSHKLPDLVAALGGQVQIDLAARVDSVRGRLRSTFEAIPDVPLRKFALTLHGGDRGLFINSGGLCRRERPVTVDLRAQNGKRHLRNPAVKTNCGRVDDRAQPSSPTHFQFRTMMYH